jgi:hypothetical protein
MSYVYIDLKITSSRKWSFLVYDIDLERGFHLRELSHS